MDFRFDETQELLRQTTRRFLGLRLPISALRPLLEAPEVVDREIWREGAALGWTAMLVAGEHGGGSVTAQPLVDLVVIAEELGRGLFPGPFVPTNVVADAVGRFGTDAQRNELLPGIVAGDTLAAWCLTGDGSCDPSEIAVRAAVGDELCLDGVAGYVHGATVADTLLVAARTNAGVLHALVPSSADGLTVRRLEGLDLTRRLAEVRFDGVRVPRSAVLLEAGEDGDPLVERALAVATVLQAAEVVGAADHVLETTIQYARDRVQFGRPIGSFQAIKHRMANLHVAVEAMRAATHYAALALAEGLPDAAEAVAVAGEFVPDSHAHLCGEAVQLHGGVGFTWEHDAHLFLRRAKVDQVLYGASHVHRERLCRLVEASAGEREPG